MVLGILCAFYFCLSLVVYILLRLVFSCGVEKIEFSVVWGYLYHGTSTGTGMCYYLSPGKTFYSVVQPIGVGG